MEVQALLEKLPPSTIALDPSLVGTGITIVRHCDCSSVKVDRASAAVRAKEAAEDAMRANASASTKPVKNKTKGRSRTARRLKAKQQNVIDQKRVCGRWFYCY